MRIVQIIDSLEVGGAERMAVNYANALSGRIEFSALATTRNEGTLKSEIVAGTDYLFLNKKYAVDFPAILRFRAYCKKNRVSFIHAHGTSFFFAFLVKLTLPSIQIIWHEHKGARSGESLGQNFFLWCCSRFFSGIIVVDHELEKWCRSILRFKNVLYLPNFTIFSNASKVTFLQGETGKRILCLANLREPKNHFLLIAAAERLKEKHPEWTFHLVGNDVNDTYSKEIKNLILTKKLTQNVFLYGTKNDTAHIIGQSDIAVLTSNTEGLPVALLEYGLHGKPVVVTDVGEMPLIIENGINGFVVPSGAAELFCDALVALIENPTQRDDFGKALQQTITNCHSEEAVIQQYLNWMKSI